MNEINLMMTDGALVVVGNINDFEATPIYWGMAGTMFRKNAFTFFIRPSSKAASYLEQQEQFSIGFYYPRYRQHLSHLSVEGNDIKTKVKEINFHPVAVENVLLFQEAYLNYICKKITSQRVDPLAMDESFKKIYFSHDDGLLMVIGEVILEIEEENLDK